MKTSLLVLFFIFIYLCHSFSEDSNDWKELDDIQIRDINDRKYAHTKEELDMTKNIAHIDPKPCIDVHPISVLINSKPSSSDKRKALRDTWVSKTKKLNVSVYFAICSKIDQTVEKRATKRVDHTSRYHSVPIH